MQNKKETRWAKIESFLRKNSYIQNSDVQQLLDVSPATASRILAALDVSSESAAGATATILTGEDPYAGRVGEESPTSPVKTVVDLTGGVYAAPAWSFSTIVIGD